VIIQFLKNNAPKLVKFNFVMIAKKKPSLLVIYCYYIKDRINFVHFCGTTVLTESFYTSLSFGMYIKQRF
jgi:hypothetical protein